MPRGGKRTSAPGVTHPQRTDLNGPSTQPVQVGPSQQYGQAAQQMQSQQAVPLPNNQVMPGPIPVNDVPTGPMPGDLPGLLSPTARPGEPVTHGSSSGPGGGPEVLAQVDPNAEDLMALRNYLPALEMMANLPNASIQTRNFVRRVRGAMPTQMPEA